MKIPSRRRLGAIALIIAGIVAVGVPFFLLHSASPQGTSPSPTTTSGNNNSGSNGSTTSNLHGGSPGSSTCTQDCSTTGSGSDSDSRSGGSSTSCSDSKSHDSGSNDESSDVKAGGSDNDKGKQNGNAFGVLKNQLDTTVALVRSMGVHNSAFHQQHDTKTDNHTVHDPEGAGHDSDNDDQSCASTADANEQD